MGKRTGSYNELVFNMLSVSFLWDIWVIDRYMRYTDLDISKEV